MGEKRARQTAKRKARQERQFGKHMRKRNESPLGDAALPNQDVLMLMAGKQFLEQETGNVFELADDSILVVVDVRDGLGAMWACIQLGMLDDAGDDDARARTIIEEFSQAALKGPDGEDNPHPFVAFWAKRTGGLLDWLQGMGFGVPPDWARMIERPPHAGNVYTILKRNGAGLLMSMDYSQIESLGVVPVHIGAGDETGKGKAASDPRPATGHEKRRAQAWVNAVTKTHVPQGVGSEAHKDRLHMLEHNRSLVEKGHNDWIADGKNPADGVIILVDVDDPVGSKIAATHIRDDEADAVRSQGGIPTLGLVVERNEAALGFSGSHPEISSRLAEGPPTGMWLVLVASGGATLLLHEESGTGT